jgi:hypothetical protein
VPAFGQHLHQLYYNNSNWTDTDLTSLVGGPYPAQVGITAFNTTPNNALHVFYVSNSDSHIHELFYNGSFWSDADLTAASGGVTAVTSTFSAPNSGFALGNAQYFYFCGSDDAVHEYSYGDGGNWNWVDRNLNALVGVGAPNCSAFSNGLVAYATLGNSQRHVFFQPDGGSSDIYQLVLKGSAWYVEDETGMTHGAKGDGTWMAGFAIGNAQYAFFEDPKGRIHEYSYGAGGKWNWVAKNLTAVTKGGTSRTSSYTGVAAFVIPGTSQMEVYYGTSYFDMHQMTFQNKKWTDADIGGPGPVYQSQIVGFATTPNDQFHVYHQSEPGGQFGVYQHYFNGSWSSQQLSNGLTEGGLTGFAIGNLQYVYYISFD